MIIFPFWVYSTNWFSIYIIHFQLEFKKFPLNARERLQFIGIKQTGIFVVIIYSFTALLNMILVPMVEEKACGVKEFLRIASAQSYLNNVTFFFTNLLIGCIIFGATLIIAACYQLLGHVAAIWLIILLFLYLTSAIAFTFLLSVAFDSGKFMICFNVQNLSVFCFTFPFGVFKNVWISRKHIVLFRYVMRA